MKAQYYDPLFYISSEEMPFTICIEVTLKEKVDREQLEYAVRTAMKRYPYFAMRVIKEGEEYLSVPNEKPVVIYPGPDVFPLGGPEVNGHLIAVSFLGKKIFLHVSHVITDGGGFFPFVKTVLYYYISGSHHVQLDPAGINLAEDPLFEDETGNPYPEEKMKNAKPLYLKKTDHFFRLSEGGYVQDKTKSVFRFRVREDEMMRFNYDHDGSPCALVSVLMTKAIWELHPETTENIVSAVSFNLRPGLGNRHSYRMLCSSVLLDYPNRMRDNEIARLCTCSRGMVTVQSQQENVLYYAQKRRERFEALEQIPDLAGKKELFGKKALKDSTDNTFSVSYVGRLGFGEMEPYLDSIYNLTDGSTYRTLFIEISLVNGWFDIAFLQGFSSDVYYKAFLEQLERNGLTYVEESSGKMGTPKMILP